MEDEKLVRGVDRCQQLEVEPDLAEILMTELLFLVVVRIRETFYQRVGLTDLLSVTSH